MKRLHCEVTGPGEVSASGSSQPSKRPKTKTTSKHPKDGVALLLAHSDELLDCLQSLKNGETPTHDTLPARFVELSQILLPAFESISNIGQKPTSARQGENNDPPIPTGIQTDKKDETESTHSSTSFKHPIPPLGPLTAWALSDIPATHPPLPHIPDAVLEKMAFTHHGARLNDFEESYEKLEFLGDAFIYHVASEYLSQTFPNLMPGRLSHLRERLVRNSNLAQYSLHYGFDKRVVIPPELQNTGQGNGSRAGGKERQKLYGDIFEAYVGALIHSGPQGVELARGWLKPLWALTLQKDIQAEVRQQQAIEASDVPVVPKSAKVQLSSLIGCSGVKINYNDVQSKVRKDKNHDLPLFTIGLTVEGWGQTTFLGHGSDLSKKDAGNKAAEAALRNKKALKFYINKKMAFLAAREAQEEAGA